MKLCRSTDNYWIAGICAGMADYLGWSAGRVRLVWSLVTLFTAFAGVFVYFVLWFLMPKAVQPPASKNFEPAVLQPWRKQREF